MASGCRSMAELPPLPSGFTLDGAPADIPPLPAGFTLDSERAAPSGGALRQTALAGRAVGEGVFGSYLGGLEEFSKVVQGRHIAEQVVLNKTGKTMLQHEIANF